MANPNSWVGTNTEFDDRWTARVAFLSGLPQDEQKERNLGRYFSAMDKVWGLASETIQDDWFSPIQRTPAQGALLYGVTVANENLSYPMSQSDSSSLTNTLQRTTRFDMFQNPMAEKAHLFSDAPVCHKAYGFLAHAATGKAVDNPGDRLKLLNGVKKPTASRRSSGSGLKHHKFNKLYLSRQKDFYDSDPPSLVLLPIYNLEQVLGWNGMDEYDVMAITIPSSLGSACSGQVLQAALDTCDPKDVDVATELLRCFIKAIACSVKNDPVDESFTDGEKNTSQRPLTGVKKWILYRNELQSDGATVRMPHMLKNIDWATVKVAKARMSRHTSLPDPFNVAVKAAINFSAVMEANLMPACPPQPDSDESSDGEMNSVQDDERQWSQRARVEDYESLLRSFGQPVI